MVVYERPRVEGEFVRETCGDLCRYKTMPCKSHMTQSDQLTGRQVVNSGMVGLSHRF
jgi:hypothetical protein